MSQRSYVDPRDRIARLVGCALIVLCLGCALSARATSQAEPEHLPVNTDATAANAADYEPLPYVSPVVVSNAPPVGESVVNWPIPLPSPATVMGMTSGPVAAFLNSSNRPSKLSAYEKAEQARLQLETARYYRNARRAAEAVPLLIDLLADSPLHMQKSALLELAAVAQEENDPSRALQIYGQFLTRWSEDPRVPEVLLRQGQLFRQIGLNNLALTKFYAVMTSALVLKSDRLDYYARTVLQAQVEIAETHYQLGKYNEASDFFSRLLKQSNPALNKPQILYKLLRCQSAIANFDGAVSTGQDFLTRYPNAPEVPEVRFYLALALKEIGRNNEALQQVLTLLREQSVHADAHPEVWAYWQQRTGNIIANQLYREGDFAGALDIYASLVRLDTSPGWQIPVNYQIGITYERLWQPQKAIEVYNGIISREAEISTNSPASLKSLVDMARWRINFIQWQGKADADNHSVKKPTPAPSVTASLPAPKSPPP